MQTLSVPTKRVIRPTSLRQTRAVGCCARLSLAEENARFFLLAFLLCTYMLLGAVIFQNAEADKEREDREEYQLALKYFRNNYTNVPFDILQQILWKHGNASMQGLMYKRPRWDFAGSLYFVGTLVSTIGFGMSAPRTVFGKIFVIFYGFFGCASAILFFNLFLERIITLLSYVLRALEERRHRKQGSPSRKAGVGTPRIEISDASVDTGPPSLEAKTTTGRTTRRKLPMWKPSVYGVQLCLIIIATCWVTVASVVFRNIENWKLVESVYYCFVAFSTIGFGDYVASQQSHDSAQGGGYWIHIYRFFNFVFLTIGCCCIYSLFNVTSVIIRQFLDRLIKRMDIPCQRYNWDEKGCFKWLKGRRQAKTHSGLGLKEPLQRLDRLASNVSSEGDESRRSSNSSCVSLREFLAQNQSQLVLMQRHLVMTRSLTKQEPSSLGPSKAITENAVGPLQILSKTFGSE